MWKSITDKGYGVFVCKQLIVLKNGEEVVRLISNKKRVNEHASISFITDLLTGVLKGDYDDKIIRKEKMSF